MQKEIIQNHIDPLVISWGYEAEIPRYSKYLDYHQWQGTQDPSSYLTIPDVINFLNQNNWSKVSKDCYKTNIEAREMVNNCLNQMPISEDNFIGQMSSIKVRCKDPLKLQEIFYTDYQIVVPIVKWGNNTLLRFSIQAYNSIEDIEKLVFAIKKINL